MAGEAGEQPTPIENLSAEDLRREIVEGINTTLGKLAVSPVADGTGAFGYNREWDRKKRQERGGMFPLVCSYVRFTKAFEADEQVGVRLELLGISNNGGLYVALKNDFDQQMQRVSQMTVEEKEELAKLARELESEKQAIEQDGLAPAENRYYFMPLSKAGHPIVSTESFIGRAYRINPATAAQFYLPYQEATESVEPITGKPRTRTAILQDLRDAASIVRGYSGPLKHIIEVTPKEIWGRLGITH